MRNGNKAGGVMGTIPSMGPVVILYKAQKSHASTCTTLEAIGHLVYELSKLRLRAHIDGLLKSQIKCIIGEAGGVVGFNP